MAVLVTAIGAVMYMHAYVYGGFFLMCGVFHLFCAMALWWRDVIREATFEGMHTKAVQSSTRLGFVFFIISEVMFFFGFFWAFFYSALAPSIAIGCAWPPMGITPFNPYGIPLVNTIFLLLSGATITYTHACLVKGKFTKTYFGFIETLMYAVGFTLLQCEEYLTATFAISDGIYGSVFYMITGLHGTHVIIGTLFIGVCFIRFLKSHFTRTHHLGFEFSAWYWHFVDVVWLFVYLSLYWWSFR
jgi:cytochrome c oxidase subunit 3